MCPPSFIHRFWELEALLQELESRGATSQVQQKLPAKLAECKAKLGKVLEHKPKSEEARAKVKSGSVELEIDGEKQTIALDEEPDIRLVRPDKNTPFIFMLTLIHTLLPTPPPIPCPEPSPLRPILPTSSSRLWRSATSSA